MGMASHILCDRNGHVDPLDVMVPKGGKTPTVGGFMMFISMGKSIYKWIMTGGTPISRNLHISTTNTCGNGHSNENNLSTSSKH